MPIIDPFVQQTLLRWIPSFEKRHHPSKGIFFKYLIIASQNINRNVKTIKAHIQFRTDLLKSISCINKEFGCNIPNNNSNYIDDYYSYLYKYLSQSYIKKKLPKFRGVYVSFGKRLLLNYYQVYSLHWFYSWLFTDTPLAILVCKLDDEHWSQIKKDEVIQYFNLLNLEIDLMAAAGLTLVLDVEVSYNFSSVAQYFILYTLKDHHFSEIHFNLKLSDENKDKEKYKIILDALIQNYDLFQCYFYLYCPFFSEVDSCNQKLQILGKKPFFKFTNLSSYFDGNYHMNFMIIKPFPYYQDGFSFNKIRIYLSNISLYDTNDEKSDLTPSSFSDFVFCYIDRDDFLNFRNERVKVHLNDHSCKYCYRDDLHIIKTELYTTDPLYLMDVDAETIDMINEILDKARTSFGLQHDYEKKHIISLDTKTKISKFLVYLYCSIKQIGRRNLVLSSNQLIAVYEACKLFLLNHENSKHEKNRKGIIQQINTGEGKSIIIQVIAAVLAKMGKTVHIATSNIFLANRDYHDSYVFFQTIGIKTAVLLHKEELPTKFSDENDEYEDVDSDLHYKKDRFPDTYFGKELFNNSANMNIGVCGVGNIKRKAKIIFSTFVNFEALYLRMMENYPDIINDYFSSCSLLIDEADSILIDELANGTILSKPMNTNCKEILIYVYQCEKQNRSPKDVVSDIKRIWPNCTDICEKDIIMMYKEINLVNSTVSGFTNGKKYSIETIEIDRSKDEQILTKLLGKLEKVKNKATEAINFIYNLPIKAIETVIQKSSKLRQKKSKNDNDDKSIETNNNINDNTTKSTTSTEIPISYGIRELDKKQHKIQVKYIVPFDYDHKGHLEPNKEFNGFIQQFIAIKEIFSNPKENKNMFIKDVSMSYLYVSHPTFIKMYKNVCGFTGTIGGQYEKDIFAHHYNLDTLRIPRRLPSKGVDIPISLCRNKKERNIKIVKEIISIHQKGNPVLAIFQSLNEISLIFKMLKQNGILNIYVFDGRNQNIKPDFIAGRKGAVSLGSNICGRGTDIKNPEMPLHVIISFYTSNVRVMQQALGRTARNGEKGSTHIICSIKQYIRPINILKDKNLNVVLEEFDFKNQLQIKFIDSFKQNRSWIFSPLVDSPEFDSKMVKKMRTVKINVNRIVAFKYKFPLCLSIETFLKIQAQRIISLYNCPNSKYTWMLFQRYIREMIFESWSLLIEKTERKFMDKEYDIETKCNYMKRKIKNLYKKINIYLPNDEKHTGMVETFMWILKIVNKKWEKPVYNIFSNYSFLKLKQAIPDKFISFDIGFKPYNLMDCSGARISEVDEDNRVPAIIIDPELIYFRKEKLSGHKFRFSITEAIDKIFNRICNEINNVIGATIGLKFFLRRTLVGCEFGVCFDFNLKNIDETFIEQNCLIDRDPLFIFTINVRSMAPFLAGILIFGLVYLISLSATIASYIGSLPEKVGLVVVKKTLKFVLNQLLQTYLSGQLEAFCNKIIEFLSAKFNQQIQIISSFNTQLGQYLVFLSEILETKEDFPAFEKKIKGMFENKIKIKSNFAKSFITDGLPIKHFMKIGILLIMCFASFLFIFNNQKKAIKSNDAKSQNDLNNSTDTNLETSDSTNNNEKNDFLREGSSMKLQSDIAETRTSKVAKSFDNSFSDDDTLNKLLKRNSDVYEEKDTISADD